MYRAQQQADADDRDEIEKDVAYTDGADRRGTERADHDRVHDAHEHPAKFGKYDRTGKTQQFGELLFHASSQYRKRQKRATSSKIERCVVFSCWLPRCFLLLLRSGSDSAVRMEAG